MPSRSAVERLVPSTGERAQEELQQPCDRCCGGGQLRRSIPYCTKCPKSLIPAFQVVQLELGLLSLVVDITREPFPYGHLILINSASIFLVAFVIIAMIIAILVAFAILGFCIIGEFGAPVIDALL